MFLDAKTFENIKNQFKNNTIKNKDIGELQELYCILCEDDVHNNEQTDTIRVWREAVKYFLEVKLRHDINTAAGIAQSSHNTATKVLSFVAIVISILALFKK